MRSRLARRLLRCAAIGLVGLGILALALVAFLAWLGTDGGNRWLARRVPTLSGLLLSEGTLEVREIAIELGTGVRLVDVRLISAQGKPVLQLGQVVADLDLSRTLSTFTITVPHLRAEGFVLDMTTGADGVSDLSRMFGGPAPKDEAKEDESFDLPVSFDAPDVVIDGVHVRTSTPERVSFQLAGVSARASLVGKDDKITISDLVAAGQLVVPGPIPITADGGLTYDDLGLGLSGLHVRVPYAAVEGSGVVLGDAMSLAARIDALDLAHAITPLAADTGVGGQWAGSVTVVGPMSALEVTAGLHGEGGTVGALVANLLLDVKAEIPGYSLVAELDTFHVDHVYTRLEQPVVLGGVVHVDGAGLSYPDDLSLRATWNGRRQEAYGQVLDRIDLEVQLADGLVVVDHAAVEGIVGQIAAVGQVDLVRGPLRLEVTGRLERDRLAALGAEGFGTDGILVARVTSDLKARPLVIEAAGTVAYAPFRYADDVTIRHLTAGFDARVAGADVQVGIDLDGDGIDAYGATASRTWSRDVFVHVPAGGGATEVDGTITTDDVAYATAFAASTAVTELSIRAGDALAVDAQVTLGDHVIAQRPGTAGTLTVALRDDDLTFDAAFEDLGRTVIDTGGTFDLAAGQVTVGHMMLAPTPRIVFTDQGPWSVTLADGGAKDIAVALAGTLGTIEVHGSVSTSGPSDLAVRVRDLQLDVAAELYPEQASDLSGELDLDVTLEGTMREPVVNAALALTGLFVPDALRWLDIAGTVRLEDDAMHPDIGMAVSGRPLAQITGTVPVTGGLEEPDLAWDEDVSIAIALHPGELTRFADLLPALEDTLLPSGVASAALDVTGPLTDPDLRLGGVAELVVQGWTVPGRVELVAERVARDLLVSADVRRGLESKMAIHGTATTRIGEVIAWATGHGAEPDLGDYALWADDMTVSVLLAGMNAESLAGATGAPIEVAGELLGGFVITGSPMTPTVEGGINWLDAKIAGQRLEGAFLSLVPAEGYGYDLNVTLAFPEGALEVTGTVPVEVDLAQDKETWPHGDLDLTIRGPSVPVAFLTVADPGIEHATGEMAIEGHVGGSVWDPEPTLGVKTEGASLSYTPLNLKLPTIDLEVTADRTRLEVALDATTEPASGFRAGDVAKAGGIASGGTPRIQVHGSTGLDQWKPTGVSARIEMSGGAWLSATNDMKLRTNGTLEASGRWPALQIDGNIEVDRGAFEFDAASFATAAPLEPDRVIAIHRPGVDQPPERAPEEPPIYADFVVNVDVDLGRNIDLKMWMPFVDDFGQLGAVLATLDLEARVGGEVDLSLENGEPSLVGEVEVIDGDVRVLNSNLHLEPSTITFAGGSPSEDAQLDLKARMDVEGGSLEMAISGTPVEPEIELSSQEYPDEAAQITMLLTGQAPDDLSGDTGAGAVAGMIMGSVVGGLKLGSVSIEPDGSAKVTVPVNRNLRASSLIDPFPEPNENQYTVIAEWSVSKSVIVVGSLGDVDSSLDIYWEYRF